MAPMHRAYAEPLIHIVRVTAVPLLLVTKVCLGSMVAYP